MTGEPGNKETNAGGEPDLTRTLIPDRRWLQREWQRIADSSHSDVADRKHRWQQRLLQSRERFDRRAAALPKCQLDDSLPVSQMAEEIATAIREHPVVVLSGETGSGKSTQLPLICLQTGYGLAGRIGHTQPRRIAARGVAARIAEQTGGRLGESIGYKIRFGDKTSDTTLVKLMTDGILLAETASDRSLDQYEVIIVDEAHERSLNIDFLLGYLRRLLPRRPELRIIVTSATIDTDRFAKHFTVDPEHPVPVIDVAGRTYPVDIEYRGDEDAEDSERDLEDRTVEAVLDLAARDRGDMLVFLPTEQAIRSLHKRLRALDRSGELAGSNEVLPLYARLSNDQQNAVFHPGRARRIVLATNVAESSITVPRIRYVVDQGTARISRYAPRSKVQRLPIEAISQASADQRAGRCGRVGPGVCVRLYSEDDYQQRARFTTPEIRRTNLASVILQTEALQLGALDEFPLIDPPGPDAIRDGYRTLFEIGAVDERRGLTAMGRKLARMPVDPRIGRILFAGADNGCLEEILTIAAALEVADPRVRPADKQAAADEAHSPWLDDDSDFMAYLNLWDWLQARKESLSNTQFRRACATKFLSFPFVQQWFDVHRQLRLVCREHRLPMQSDRENYASIHGALLSGFLSGVAHQTEKREYTGAGGVQFLLWPGSGVAKAKNASEWILVGEIVETSQRFGRLVARIREEWIEPLAGHLVKKSYGDPWWSRKRQSAMTNERVTLFGLPIVAARPVRLGPIDPPVARQLLIQQGLVSGEFRSEPEFLKRNRAVLESIREKAARTRQRDLVIDDHVIESFYEQRLPESIVDGATLASAIRKRPALDKELGFTPEDLLGSEDDAAASEAFPDTLAVGALQLPLEYRFTPGTEDDGVNVVVPVEGLPQLHENHLEWSVPGMMEKRIVALIRSLPKRIRRNLVPAPETATTVASHLEFGSGSFLESVARELGRIAEEPVAIEDFRIEKLDDALRINIKVVDEAGEVLVQGRDLRDVRMALRREGDDANDAAQGPGDSAWHADGLRNWTWEAFPEEIVVRKGVADVPLFPAIVVDPTDRDRQTVRLRTLDHREAAEQATRRGLAVLYRNAQQKAIRSQVRWLPLDDLMKADFARKLAAIRQAGSDKGNCAPDPSLDTQLELLVASMAFVDRQKLPRTEADYRQHLVSDVANERVGVVAQSLARWLPPLFENWHALELELTTLPDRYQAVAEDVRDQVQFLFGRTPFAAIPPAWLEHYPRFVKAALVRLERLRSGGEARDAEQSRELVEWKTRFQEASDKTGSVGEFDAELEHLGWMIEEYRVSLFAQQLGTSETVSPQRLEKQWNKVRFR